MVYLVKLCYISDYYYSKTLGKMLKMKLNKITVHSKKSV